MKKILLSSSLKIIFLLAFHLSSAQVNTYFQHYPVWQITSAFSVPAPCIQEESFNYYSSGDTVINLLTYKKIYKKGRGIFNWYAPPPVGCSGTYNYIDTLPSFFLRSAGKQMFVSFPLSSSEQLLYDFNLSVGDTLPLSFNNFFSGVTVYAIDSVYTPYGYLQRFALSGGSGSQYLIEGIGHSRGLIEPLQTILEGGFLLTCFSLNDTSYFPSIGATCNLAIGIESIDKSISLSVSPNPFSNLLSFTSESNEVLEVNLYDIASRRLINQKFTHSISLNTEQLATGIYLYEIRSKDGSFSKGKVLKN